MSKINIANLMYTEHQISRWFGVSSATLSQWENDGMFEKPDYLDSGERLYKKHHIEKISELVRHEIRKEMDAFSEEYPDQTLPQPELLELLYKVELFSGNDIEHALQQIEGLAIENGLSQSMCLILVAEALARPKADPVRRHIWQILLADSTSVEL